MDNMELELERCEEAQGEVSGKAVPIFGNVIVQQETIAGQ